MWTVIAQYIRKNAVQNLLRNPKISRITEESHSKARL